MSPRKRRAATVLTLKDFFTSLAWAEFPTSAVVGTDVDLGSVQPVSVPEYGGVGISKVSGGLSVTVTVMFSHLRVTTTECVIKVVASKTGYVSISETYRVTPDEGNHSGWTSWGTYGAVNAWELRPTPPALTFSHPSGGTGVSSAYATGEQF